MAGGTVLSGEQTGNAACPHLLGARTWSVALPASHSPILRPFAATRPETGGPQTNCSFFPGIPDPREVRTRVSWPVISVALDMSSVCRKARAVATTRRRTSTWLPNTAAQCSSNKSEPNYSCVPLFIPGMLRYATWAVEGVVVTGNFRRAPDKLCSYFTVANVHINNECAQKAVRVHRGFSSGTCASSSAQWCSPAISTRVLNTSSPWCLREPAPHFHARASLQFGTCSLTHLRSEQHGDKWLECCGFVVLPGSQKDWLILCQLSLASRPPTRRSSGQPLIS